MNMFKSILFVCLFFASSLDQSSGLTIAPSSPSKMCANTSVCVKNASQPLAQFITCQDNMCGCSLPCLEWKDNKCSLKPCYSLIENNKCETVGADKLTIILTSVFVSFTGTPFFLIGGSLCIALGIIAILSAFTCGVCLFADSAEDDLDTRRMGRCCIKISVCLQICLWITAIFLGVLSFLWGNVTGYGFCPLVNPNF